MANIWKKLPCLSSKIQLEVTLTGGQSFRWKKYNSNKDNVESEWLGVMANCVWLLKQNETDLCYKIIGELPYPNAEIIIDEPDNKKIKLESTSIESLVRMKIPPPKPRMVTDNLLYEDEYYENLLKSYFRLDVNLEKLYKEWSQAHEHFRNNAGQFYAVRMLDQDPVENLFSFICSQNNHISRISTMVEKLCSMYGPKICSFENITYHAFPDPEILSGPNVEDELRKASFGYRAKFISKSSAQIVSKGGIKWFDYLQKLDYESARNELVSLHGIGLKVADCICLMSLNHLQAIPVDTHVYKIAIKYYLTTSTHKKGTAKMYADIGDEFRRVYSDKAGWAQTVLFCADLDKFKNKKENIKTNKKVISK